MSSPHSITQRDYICGNCGRLLGTAALPQALPDCTCGINNSKVAITSVTHALRLRLAKFTQSIASVREPNIIILGTAWEPMIRKLIEEQTSRPAPEDLKTRGTLKLGGIPVYFVNHDAGLFKVGYTL